MRLTTPLPRLDRASHLRSDRERLLAALDEPDTLLVPVWRNQSWVRSGAECGALLLTVATSGALVDAASELVWLGLIEGKSCFALDLSESESPAALAGLSGGAFTDLRAVGGWLAATDVEVLAYARGMLRWHRHHRFCGRCGRPTVAREGGHVRECEQDQEKQFPRTDPAIMLLAVHEGRCALARQTGWPDGMYSAIAGFVEPGETLEEAAAREAQEELGLDVDGVAYFRSQPWPFPASLMIGFHASAKREQIQVDGTEIEEARWFTRSELENPQGFCYPPPYSLAHHLIQAFIKNEL